MGILSSMYTGITGLQGQGEALSIYGDNIANANTVGFKVSRPEFQDVVAKSLKGLLGGNPRLFDAFLPDARKIVMAACAPHCDLGVHNS